MGKRTYTRHVIAKLWDTLFTRIQLCSESSADRRKLNVSMAWACRFFCFLIGFSFTAWFSSLFESDFSVGLPGSCFASLLFFVWVLCKFNWDLRWSRFICLFCFFFSLRPNSETLSCDGALLFCWKKNNYYHKSKMGNKWIANQLSHTLKLVNKKITARSWELHGVCFVYDTWKLDLLHLQ